MGIDILGIDIMGVDILGIDIPAPTHLKQLTSPKPFNISHAMRKPVFQVSNQVLHKPGYTTTEDG